MERSLFDKYQKLETKKVNSERADLIQQFLLKVNQGREGTKYKPMTARGIAVKLGHIPTKDLYFFIKKCEQSKCFSKCFWGSLKIK